MDGILKSLIQASTRNEFLSAIEICGNMALQSSVGKEWLASIFACLAEISNGILRGSPEAPKQSISVFSNISKQVRTIT